MVNIQKLTTNDILKLTKVKKIYENSFPVNERRDFIKLITLLSDIKFQLLAITFENEVVGMLSKWDFDSFIYIEHFAIASDFRGNGMGSYILQNLLQDEIRQIVLEVELPDDEISLKRIKFYEKFGFHCCQERYIQPPYDKDKESVSMLLMTTQLIDSLQDFQYIKNILYHEVYNFIENHINI